MSRFTNKYLKCIMKKLYFILIFLWMGVAAIAQDTTDTEKTFSFNIGPGICYTNPRIWDSELSYHLGLEYFAFADWDSFGWASIGFRYSRFNWSGTFTLTSEVGQSIGHTEYDCTWESFYLYGKYIYEYVYAAAGFGIIDWEVKTVHRLCPSFSLGFCTDLQKRYGAEAGCTIHWDTESGFKYYYFYAGLVINI